jgi:diguanylate cyclase (GGDEF)-like protein
MAVINKNSEKRQYRRQEINVEASLAIGEMPPLQCCISDFSEQGMFLRLNQPTDTSLQKNKIAKIYFSTRTDAGKEYFQIDAKVVRVTNDGLGVAFENISDSMFRALQETTGGGGVITGYSKNPKFTFSSSTHDSFKDALITLLNRRLPELIGEFFNEAENELEKPTEYAENFKDIAAQSNIISVLRMNKAALIKKYCDAVTHDIDFTAEKNQHSVDEPSRGNLSLIEKEAFENLLTFSSVVRKINAQYKQQLYQLELKLSYVTCFPRFLIRNPIDPERLCECFSETIGNIEESSAVKKTLFKALQTTLSNNLSNLYNAFDALLVEQGAPNDIAEDIVWKKNYPSNAKQSSTSRSNDFFEQQHPPSFDSDSYYYADNSHSSHYESSAPRSRPSFQQPVSQTATKLFNLINQNLPQAQSSSQSLVTQNIGQNSAESAYSVDELIGALTKLQATRTAQQLPQNAANILQSQLAESQDSSSLMEIKSFSPADKTKLDVYDQLYQALINQLMLTPGIKSYFENIKLPLMALTLQDPNFLDSENHPARDLLNQLFSLESAINQNKVIKNTKIRQMLDQLVEKIAQGSINNPDIFAKANEELKEISAPIVKSRDLNIRRVIEIHEGKQKLELSRQKIQHAIDQRIAGKTIPKVIQTLLDSGWQHLLVINQLEDDKANIVRDMEVVDELLGWYDNVDQITDKRLSAVEMELEYIDTKLGAVSTNAFIHAKIIEELKGTLLGSGSPRIRKPFETISLPKREIEPVKDAKDDIWQLQIDQFETGDWFTFSLEKEAFEPLKLVWIGQLPKIFVFVNRDGYKKQELTRDQLADLLQSGIATKIENLDEPLMDRATTTMLQQMQEKLIHSVSHDPTTNLPNRRRFIGLLREQIADPNNPNHVLGYLEIEDFRIITNICGLVGGDQLLLQVAKLIESHLGKNGIVSRLGDKTFGIFFKNCTPDEGQETSKTIRDSINKTNFVWNDKSYTISVSIGLVPITGSSLNVEELLQKADSVNISAKRAGHNRIRIYQENDETLKTQTNIHEWAGRIDKIFAENRLFARCQMIAPIDTERNTHSHYEILLGVTDENGKFIPPDNFIPAVEQCQRMPEIDRWIVEHVFNWICDNREKFDKIGGFAINLSGQSLNSEDFLSYLKERLARNDIPTEKITFEVTETVAAGSLVFTKRFIKEIKQFGCSFSLDDFGTGYSSYSYLKSLDVDYLKIDGSFIKDIAGSPTDVVMVNSMNEIAHSLELQTIAEYVENMKIHAILTEIGVDYAQGWGIHKPIPLVELAKTL